MTPDGAPATWGEIDAWARLTGRALSTWEAETLKQMSRAYVAMYNKAGDLKCMAPWCPSKVAASKRAARAVIEFFRPMAERAKRGGKRG